MRIVLALGGNALLARGQALTAENQRDNIKKAAHSAFGFGVWRDVWPEADKQTESALEGQLHSCMQWGWLRHCGGSASQLPREASWVSCCRL